MREACLYNNWSFVPIFLKIYRALMRWTPWSFLGEVAVMGDDAIYIYPGTGHAMACWSLCARVSGHAVACRTLCSRASGHGHTGTQGPVDRLTVAYPIARSRSQLSGCTINQRCVVSRDSPLEPFVLPAPGAPGQPELARLTCGAHLRLRPPGPTCAGGTKIRNNPERSGTVKPNTINMNIEIKHLCSNDLSSGDYNYE